MTDDNIVDIQRPRLEAVLAELRDQRRAMEMQTELIRRVLFELSEMADRLDRIAPAQPPEEEEPW